MAAASVTAGFKCAPEIGANVRISASNAAPVAIVFASRAIATFPPAKRCPIMPDPTTAATRNALPKNSAVSRARRGNFIRDRSLFDRSLFDRSLGDRSLGDRLLGDRLLGDRLLLDRLLLDRSLLGRS